MNDKDPIASSAEAAAKSHPPLMQVATQDLAVLKRQDNDMSNQEGASDMTKEQMLSKINQLSDEIDANEEENRTMQEQINQLYARIDSMPEAATK